MFKNAQKGKTNRRFQRGSSALWFRRRWFLATSWGVSALGVVSVAIPAALASWRDIGEHAEMVAIQTEVRRGQGLINRLEKSEPERLRRLNELRSRLHRVGDDDAIRARWMQIIRRHQGRIRQLEIREPFERAWTGVTDTLHDEQIQFPDQQSSGFTLQSQSVVMRIEANFDSVEKIVQEILSDDPVAELVQLLIAPMAQDGDVELQLEMTLYGLSNDTATNIPLVAQRDLDVLKGVQH